MPIHRDNRCVALVEGENFFLPYLLAQLARSGHIGRILLYAPRRSWKSIRGRLMHNVGAFGWMGIGACALDAVIARFLDLMPGRYYSVQKVAKSFDIPLTILRTLDEAMPYLIHGADGRRKTVFAQISDRIGADLLVRADFINKHCGLLPFYRGIYPVYWAMLNDEPVFGVTLHRMDDQFDTGPVLDQKSISAKDHDFFSAHHELYDLVAVMVRGYLEGVRIPGVPQDPSKGSYYSYPGRSERKILFRKRRLGSPLRLHPRLRSV